MLYKFPMASVRGFFRGVGEFLEALGDIIEEPFRRMGENYKENTRKADELYGAIGRAHGANCPRCGGTGRDRFPPFGPCPGG
jgi:hypothetical protein